ncbi:MAG: NADH-quinone oxidoreductase subunit B [Bacteriovoracia bacterium]
MSAFFKVTSVDSLLKWSRAKSLWYFSVGTGCCSDEVTNAFGCRYDLERFGSLPQVDPLQADLLIVSGAITYRLAPVLKELYDRMPSPKYVLAVGGCACTGGAFSPGISYSVVPGVEKLIPVDVFVSGCPPRPEAVMNGLLTLQEKIIGSKKFKDVY